MTALLKISALPAAAARSILMSIQSGERLAPAPLTVSTAGRNTPDDEINSFLSDIRAAYSLITDSSTAARQSGERLAPAPLTVSTAGRNTPDDEINSFLSDIRAAYSLITDSSTAARPFLAYLTESADLDSYEIGPVKDFEYFFSEFGRKDLIAAAIDDLNDALDTYADDSEAAADLTLDDVSFDSLEDAIKSEAESMIEALEIKKYYDEDGAAVGAYVLIEYGGPTLFFHWLDSAGAYISATGRTTGGSATREIAGEDLEIINQLYFFGELDIFFFHWLDSAGAYISATGRTTGGSATREIAGEDLEIINQLYFFGELDI